ncbi:MAG: ATP-binding protein [Mediterranea sp.]|jgi:predicted AAA+ superfamily ATPase|nr:ATP-binding protein [Mediterranea sp.]
MMKYLKRSIDSELASWKEEEHRKPLLLRGARQVGKSSAVRNLGRSFAHYLEVNFESDLEVKAFFQGNLNPQIIGEKLSLYYDVPVIPGETLLFLDEIQGCREAIASLRFFYERYPELHVVAAGSLLEFALVEIPSFAVGRLRSIFLYPMSFDEFLAATGQEGLIEVKRGAGFANPVDNVFHQRLNEQLRKFLVLGGMPEVVSLYLQTGDMLRCMRALDDLYISLRDDFAKYKSTVPAVRLREVFDSVVEQAGGRFVYSRVGKDNNYRQVKEAVDLLVMAGLVVPVYKNSGNGLPIGAGANSSIFKLLALDFGLAQRMARLDISPLLVAADGELVNKGAIAEQFAALEILKNGSPYTPSVLYFWQREARNSNAEVDFLLPHGDGILPLEIKAGTRGSMRSLSLFLAEKGTAYGLRSSMENFGEYDRVKVCPLYALGDVVRGMG